SAEPGRLSRLVSAMADPEKILVCVAWPYANGPRHIGHVAGYGVPSDVFARFQRLRGNQVLMVSGTDEHGTPITYGANKEGIPPREFADRNNAIIVEDQLKLGLSYDCFTRTTTRNHYRVVQDLFKTLYEKGYIVERSQLGAISPSTGRTLPDPRRPNVRTYSLNYIAELKPRAITRDLDWGVPVPLPGWEERPDKRIYVWFDAVIGYLSAAVEWAHNRGTPEAWRDWWQDPAARHYYFMGKDNITFHTVMGPAILMGAGDLLPPPSRGSWPARAGGGERGGLQLPYDVVASEFLTM